MRGARWLQSIFLMTLLLAFSLPLLAQAQTERALTNADVARMMKAGVPESIIVREIQTSKTDLNTGPNGLIELKNQGASEGILGAVLESRNAAGKSAASTDLRTQSAAPGAHRLPNFQADLKIKSNSLAKVSMTQNHIKVERGGMPLFDLKWKEKRN
jgi:hypothetical protein